MLAGKINKMNLVRENLPLLFSDLAVLELGLCMAVLGGWNWTVRS